MDLRGAKDPLEKIVVLQCSSSETDPFTHANGTTIPQGKRFTQQQMQKKSIGFIMIGEPDFFISDILSGDCVMDLRGAKDPLEKIAFLQCSSFYTRQRRDRH